MNDERCETCRFWNPGPPDDGVGDCRRYPPTANQAADLIDAMIVLQEGPKVATHRDEPELYTVADQLRNLRLGDYPPLMVSTDYNGWCGEYRPREES